METIRVEFSEGGCTLSLLERNERFRKALREFLPRPECYLVRDGFHPLPLAQASNEDVCFATAVVIRGQLKGRG